jgi:hypothetical protein
MQVAVLLRGESFSACPGVQYFPFGDTGVRQEVLVSGIAQNGAEGDQFMADGAVLHRFTARTLAGALAPEGVFLPFLFTHLGNLDLAAVLDEMVADVRVDNLPVGGRNASELDPCLELVGVFERDLFEGLPEDWNVVLQAEAQVGVVFERLVLCFSQALDFQSDGLVAVHPGDLHTAIPFAVLDVAAPEEDQVVFELRDIGEECHVELRFCAGSVQIWPPTS